MDTEKFISFFSADGYMRDMASGTEFRGKAIGNSIAGFVHAFPDLHRELLSVYVVDDVVVVELAMRGTHTGDMPLPSGTRAPTGKTIDVPSCDVFRIDAGKIISFRCYNEASILQMQLGGDHA